MVARISLLEAVERLPKSAETSEVFDVACRPLNPKQTAPKTQLQMLAVTIALSSDRFIASDLKTTSIHLSSGFEVIPLSDIKSSTHAFKDKP